jgi:hypothetical protein
MMILAFLYIIICCFFAWFLTWYKGLIDVPGSGLAWESHYIYICFALITWHFEQKLYI